MKKSLLSFSFMLLFCTVTYANTIAPHNLIFDTQGGGKFIYCNNDEAIWRKDLSDSSNPNPMYVMNNENLKSDKYSLFVSHINHTEIRGADNISIREMGFDIEVDVQFVAKEESEILITAAGFDVQKLEAYEENSIIKIKQSEWDFVNAWADYLQMPIYTINSHLKSEPHTFSPIEISLKKGEEVWLSQFIENYSSVAFLKSMHILSDFEITKGTVDVNVAALRHNGILRDRSHHSSNAKRGIYYRDRQYKGIADTLPAVNASLDFSIDNNTKSGTLLPVTVFNQYVPTGNTVTKWHTHINPQEDIWSRNSSAESDMLSFRYYDEEKLRYYGSNIPAERRDSIWVFDVFHSDTKESASGIPNYMLTTDVENRGNACNLGNYGVSINYNVTINNSASKQCYFNYKLNTNSTNIVILKDADGNPVHNFAVRKKPIGQKKEDIMASVALPPNTTTSFTIEVILPPNYPGGMENSFEISDTEYKLAFYESNAAQIKQPYQFTGREYIKWHAGRLYVSDNRKDWSEKEISATTKKIFEGNWNRYEIKYFGGVYAVRWKEYDEAPHFYTKLLNFCNRVYYFDDEFHLLTTHYFGGYPSDLTFKDGEIATSVDGKSFITALSDLEKTITVKLDGSYLEFDVNPMIENGRTLVPVRALFESIGAVVDWNEQKSAVKITSDYLDIELVIGNRTAIVAGTRKYMDVPARLYESRTLVPIRFVSETLGFNVVWDDLTKTIIITR